ncbi:MAG: thioesterase family protein [Selenomonadaceae bacterium]|nr:thioesterase family protein [Selenomonadaceae bacterium]
MNFENLKVGLKNSAESFVTENDTALSVSSGSLKVLATPKMIALMEKAAADLVEKILPKNFTSVGISLNIQHTAPTPVGIKISAAAEIIEVNDRKILFEIIAEDEQGEIGRGKHERFIVDREKFQKKADSKKV